MRRAESTAFRKVSRLQEYRNNPNIIKEKNKEDLVRKTSDIKHSRIYEELLHTLNFKKVDYLLF